MKRRASNRQAGSGRWIGSGCVCAAVLLLAGFAAAQQPSKTVTSTYAYNADGALTRVTVQVDDGTPTITYLTWDNFVPDTNDATQGTISSGNGNLLGYGPSPGTAALTNRYAYDLQDRLTSYVDEENTISYAYHPNWLLAESRQENGDSFEFYYGSGRNPRMTNIEQTSTAEVSMTLGPLRALSDGTQQVLLSPRKDVSGIYEPDLQTFTPYRYDPYGADAGTGDPDDEASEDYDLDDNPIRYAGEYRDPSWKGYYLRSRWYAPEFQTFITRDHFPNLNRFGYTEGNPVARVDPSGMRSFSYEKSIGRPLGKFMGDVNRMSIVGPLARVGLGPVMGVLGLVANPSGFLKGITRDHGLSGWVLLGSVALEAYTDRVASFALKPFWQSFGVRVVGDLLIGGSNSAAAATSHDFHHFNKRTFFDGLEYSAGGIMYARFVSGRGFRPFNRSLDQVLDRWAQDEESLADTDEALVFRVRKSSRGLFGKVGVGPIGEASSLGGYHEALIAFGSDRVWISETSAAGLSLERSDLIFGPEGMEMEQMVLKQKLLERWGRDLDFRLVGRADAEDVDDAFADNPTRINVARQSGLDVQLRGGQQEYDWWSRNSHVHANGIVRSLTTLRPVPIQ